MLEDRIAIKNLGHLMPNLENEQVNYIQNRKYKWTFNLTIYDKCSWLCGCKVKNKFYCFPCLLAQAVWLRRCW